MNREEKNTYAVAIFIALAIAGTAFLYKNLVMSAPARAETLPTAGKVGSDHAHASLLVMVNDRIISFCSPEYMLKSQYVHFEDNNCTVVHRHATGITIPTFLKTIGVGLNDDCLIIPNDKTYCSSGKEKVSAIVNGKEVPVSSLPYYVFHNNDHILINYGTEKGEMLRFKYNQVPPIPLSVNEPEADSPFGKVFEEKPLENVK